MTKKIIILGTTPSRMDAPIDDPSWKVWTIGPGGKDNNRWDRLYEPHGSHEVHTWPEDFKGYLNDLSLVEPPREVWLMDPPEKAMAWWAHKHNKDPETLAKEITGKWTAAKVIPKDDLLKKYRRRMWYSSSISWCIAHALEEGVTDLWLAGIDLESGEEYISQFAGAAHFIDLAILAGVNVYTPKGCGLNRDPTPYPDRYETEFALALQMRLERGNAMLNQMKNEHDAIAADQYRMEGRIAMLRELGGEGPEETARALEVKHRELLEKLGNVAARINSLSGEMGAINFIRQRYVISLHDPV